MQTIPVFYQAESLGRIEHLPFPVESSLADLLEALRAKHGISDTALLFLEDAEEPADLKRLLRDLASAQGLKVHLHRCHRIEVSVTFNGTKEHSFSPGASVARVKRWAVEKAFPMSPEDAGEHVLQIAGTTERPSLSTHLGSLTACPGCRVRFDLVPHERVNGAPSDAL
jgi:hypothetical protein